MAKCPLELPDDLRLPIGEPGFELVGRDDRDAAGCDRAADAGPVVGGLGLQSQLRTGRQIHRGDVEGVFDDAAFATVAGRRVIFDGDLFRAAEKFDALLLGLAGLCAGAVLVTEVTSPSFDAGRSTIRSTC